ncbi:hypothetical protein U1Q18_040750 [Sarracenia purpurea var. burkii]
MSPALSKAVSGGEVLSSEIPESGMGNCGATQGENRCINSGIDVDEGNGEVEGNTPNSGCLVSRDSRENEDCAADFGLCSKMRTEPPYQTGNLDYVLELNDFAVDVNGVEKGVMPLGSEIQNANKPEKVCDAHNLFDNLPKQTLSETKEEMSFAPSDEVSLSLGSELVPVAGIKVSSERKCVEGSVVVGGVIVDDNPTGQNMKQGGLGERAHSAHHMFDKMTMLEETPKPDPEEGTENVEVERDPILNEKGVSVSEVVTGEGTENEVSLEPSLLFNYDSDSVVAVDEGADVDGKVKQVREKNEDLCSARQVFEFLPKSPPGAKIEPNAKVLAPKIQGSVSRASPGPLTWARVVASKVGALFASFYSFSALFRFFLDEARRAILRQIVLLLLLFFLTIYGSLRGLNRTTWL